MHRGETVQLRCSAAALTRVRLRRCRRLSFPRSWLHYSVGKRIKQLLLAMAESDRHDRQINNWSTLVIDPQPITSPSVERASGSLPVRLSVRPSVCLSASVCLSVCPSVTHSLCCRIFRYSPSHLLLKMQPMCSHRWSAPVLLCRWCAKLARRAQCSFRCWHSHWCMCCRPAAVGCCRLLLLLLLQISCHFKRRK